MIQGVPEEQQPINFTEKFKQSVRRLGFKVGKMDELCLPKIGQTFSLDGFIYKVVYKKNNPFSFTAEAVDIDKSELKAKTQTT